MSHTPHELAEEFPDQKERIHALKTSDTHFANLADQYHEVNRTLHRIETRVEPVDESVEHDLRKQRMLLKDEIYQILRN